MQKRSSTTTAVSRPEDELLLCCARTRMDHETAERIRTLARGNVGWSYLIRTALPHGVVPLLYRSLSTACPKAVPKPILYQLKRYFQANALRNLFLTGELLKLLNLLRAERITAVPFKGPVLTASVYGSLALRRFSDLDILVREPDLHRVKALLLAQGYRREYELSPAQEAAAIRSQHAMAFVRRDGKVMVEPHWRISPVYFRFPVDLEQMWERLEPVSLVGTKVASLPAEDLLLILCMHGCKHGWERLMWVCDIAELVRARPRLRWEQILDQAPRLGIERILLVSLHLASELLGAVLPERVRQRIHIDPAVTSLAAQVRHRLFLRAGEPLGRFAVSAFRVRVREQFRDRVHYVFRYALFVMTPSVADRDLISLPPFLSFLYYLLRPVRLAGKVGRSLWQRFL